LTKVPLVEPRSVIVTESPFTRMWQCELETLGSLIWKSFDSARPSRLVPGLS
jgi:hypothetical protein